MKLTVKMLAGRAAVLAGGEGVGRVIASPQISTPALESPAGWRGLAGSVVHLPPRQLSFLAGLPAKERQRLVRVLFRQKPACIVVSGGNVAEELLVKAGSGSVPVFRSRNVPKLVRALADRLTPRISIHGVLVQIFGLGALIIGESAIGKSEAALDLVLRGHKLAADDMVILEKTDGAVSGMPTEMGADLLQIRGLGIINVRALYGETATIGSCKVGLVVELEEWKKGQQYSLVGLRERRYKLFGINIPYLRLPVKTGRNMATLIEVAARNQMLKNRGIFTARDLQRKLVKRLTA
jgi:HPr kinase/phosphorylase